MGNSNAIIYPTLDEKREVQIVEVHEAPKEKQEEEVPRPASEGDDAMDRWLELD